MYKASGGYFVLFMLCFISIQSEDEIFYGGSISYKLEEIAGKKIAHVELITGWTLGRGPCGVNCTKTDVNTLTNAKRLQRELSIGNPFYFGNFTTDYSINSGTIERDLNAIVRANYSERVIAVNEHAKWEQELMKFSFEMADATEDINFDGKFWRPLMTRNDIPWHFQTRVVHSLRSDTQRMNNCPQSLTKPFYRVKLNKISTIQIPMIDPDGDVVRCSLAQYYDRGVLPLPPGVTVYNKQTGASFCSVTIDSSASSGYQDDVWIAIPITFRDYSTSSIKFGDDHYDAGSFSLSASNAQFVVQILDNLATPEFVPPTIKGGHMFIVYVGSTWTADIYAQAPANTTIDEFITSSRNRENVSVSQINADTSRERVKFLTMSWTPSQEDTGQHILCIRAVDNTGVDSDELRCFIVEVKADTFNHSWSTIMGKPYFIDIPSYDQLVNCKVGATCLLPVFVKSLTKLSAVRITESYTDEATLGKINIATNKGKYVYKISLSFTHSMPGVEKICLSATDMNNVTSETICISAEIEPPDACLSSPCKNGASCRSDKRTGTFICECLTNAFYGTFCEKRTSPCSQNPCTAGQTQQCFEMVSPFYCYCKKGFTGKLCETNVYDCKPDSCNATTGTCRDLVNNFTCDCYQRYSGTDCTIDNCPSEGPHVLRCPAAGCLPNTCSGHGVCSHGGVCTCRMGYNADPTCSRRTETYPGSRNIQFVPPTPMDKSRYTCIIKSNKIQPCYLSVFVATYSGLKPTLNMETTRELDVNSSLGNVEASDVLQGFSNIFSADIVIRGTVKKRNGHYVCVTATDGSSQAELCLELEFVSVPTLDPLQNNATTKFVEPTQIEGSRLMGYVTETYTIILYTSYASVCEDVISLSEGVTVFPAVYDGKRKCVTEASFVLNKVGEFDICFQSAKTDFQKRCFVNEVLNIGSDHCSASPCQNNGHCFPKEGGKEFRCICQEDYKGEKCQEGPCPSNDCQNDAYCKINDGHKTCICKAGFTGGKCELKISEQKSELSFTETAIPRIFQCVIYQACSVALLLTGDKHNVKRPDVSAGYVSPTIMLSDIGVIDKGSSGSYQVNIGLKAKEVGVQDVCIQSVDKNGINKDELCFKVDVITEVSTIYGFKDRPHFIYPSLPSDAGVECPENESCHVIYNITPGEGNDKQCVSVKPTGNRWNDTYHIFTSCEPCTPGQSNNGNCTVDISMLSMGVGTVKQFCVAVSLIASRTVGETRCFNLTIIDQAAAANKKGCQTLECKNGGFCDGHIPTKTFCYCRAGFSGTSCEKAEVKTVLTGHQIQSFFGDFAVPVEIKCTVRQACQIPFQVISKSGSIPKVLLGFVDTAITVNKPLLKSSSDFGTIFEGYATSYGNKTGNFAVCIQTTVDGKIEDELCVSVIISSVAVKTDMIRPYFLPPSIPTDSTVLCEADTACHFNMHFTKGDVFGFAEKCPSMKETSSSPAKSVHIFDPIMQTDGCVTDVSYIPPLADVEQKLCVQIALPGRKGENRCFIIKSVTNISEEVQSPCRGKDCANGGQCIANLSVTPYKTECVCPFGQSGNVCKKGDICDKTCLSGGSCINGICHCETGYSGEHCERVLDPCTSNPCLRGTCFHHARQYHCLCPSGFTGKNCEINIDECLSQPCLNGGLCIDNVGSFTCNCSSGFDGGICENDINECMSQPCLNGGFCKDSIDQFLCQCRTGFDGDICQNVVDPCMKNPCVRGSCFSHGSQFLCECPPGYTGKLCDKSIHLSLNGPLESYVKVPLRSSLLLNCSVSGLYPPTFYWSKLRACDTNYDSNKASIFHLSHATLGDAGTYICTASDGYGANVTSYFHVEITSDRKQESCDFDDGKLCGWSQQTNDSFDWTLHNGPTQSDDTGPGVDHTLGTTKGKYLYIESSSPRSFGEYADLISPILPANQTMCFEFWYYMVGDGTGRLFVLLQDTCLKKETQLFTKAGDQGQVWNKGAITVSDHSIPNDYRIVIKADVGPTFHGDTSIDDLVISDGSCKGSQGVSIVG